MITCVAVETVASLDAGAIGSGVPAASMIPFLEGVLGRGVIVPAVGAVVAVGGVIFPTSGVISEAAGSGENTCPSGVAFGVHMASEIGVDTSAGGAIATSIVSKSFFST